MKSGAIYALIRGRVQGVGYRWFVHAVGRRLGLRGGVRNLRDGRVEVVAEGAQDLLDQLAEALRDGPSVADVSEVELTSMAPTGEHTDFEIWPSR